MKAPISTRLLACCDYIAPGDRVADVGCDHGYLGIHLLLTGLASRVIAADIRPGSPTFGRSVTVVLSAQAGSALYIPAGYGHGYLTLEDRTLVEYGVDAPWCPEAETACRWNDPTLAVDWGTDAPILSAKDRAAPFLKG